MIYDYGNNIEKLISLVENVKNSGTNYAVFVEKLILELKKLSYTYKVERLMR